MAVSGITLTVIGMGVVFLALGLLALAAWILERIFRVEDTHLIQDSDVRAAIALALVYHTQRKGVIHLQRVDESIWMQRVRVYQ